VSSMYHALIFKQESRTLSVYSDVTPVFRCHTCLSIMEVLDSYCIQGCQSGVYMPYMLKHCKSLGLLLHIGMLLHISPASSDAMKVAWYVQ
jgi:hypothetical protein